LTLNAFISQVWSSRILENLNDQHVYAALLNRDYEGDIKEQGDSVRINSIGRVTVNSYTKNSSINAPETLDGAGQVLIADQQNYFNFEIDDIDKVQGKPVLMDKYTAEAAWSLSDTVDAAVATALSSGTASGNQLTAATSVGTGSSDDDAYQLLVDLGTKLTENNIPMTGRWVVIPPWFHGMLQKDPRFVSFGTPENRNALANGKIGDVAGLTVHVSNNVPLAGSVYTVIAGHSVSAAFARQINKVEAFRPEGSFSDALKGLDVHGYKVTRPNGLAYVKATSA
jgi:hypothetical protein